VSVRARAEIGRQLWAARLSILGIFFLNGFGFASWVVRIPAIQEKLGLGEGLLGAALLSAAVGSLASMPLTGWLVSRFGSRPVVWVTASAWPVVLVLLALAPNLPLFVLALLFAGAAVGALDVSMNAHAVTVEREYRRPIMSSFHAAFSFGGLAGAAGGGLVAASGVGELQHLAGVAVITAVAAVYFCRGMLPAAADAEPDGSETGGQPVFVRPTRALLGLGVIAFCVLLGEGAMADWSAVYLEKTLETGPGFAAAGFAAFSLTMAVGRLSGDWLTERFGSAGLVRAGAALAAVGLGISLAVADPLFALVGFASAGAGFSIIFPATLSAAGNKEGVSAGPALAAVASAGYFGFLVGPPSIGFVAEAFGLGGALYIVVALSALIVLLAGTVGRGNKKKG
jgi:MFS family permease